MDKTKFETYKSLLEAQKEIQEKLLKISSAEVVTFEEEIERINSMKAPTTLPEMKKFFDDLNSGNIDSVDDAWESVTNFAYEEGDLDFGSFKFKHLQTEGGGEGDGEDFWMVFAVEIDGEIKSYWKWSGYYYSYDGGELDTLRQVIPQEKTITVYTAI